MDRNFPRTPRTIVARLRQALAKGRGASGVEYGLLLGLLAMVLIAATGGLGTGIAQVFCMAANHVSAAAGYAATTPAACLPSGGSTTTPTSSNPLLALSAGGGAITEAGSNSNITSESFVLTNTGASATGAITVTIGPSTPTCSGGNCFQFISDPNSNSCASASGTSVSVPALTAGNSCVLLIAPQNFGSGTNTSSAQLTAIDTGTTTDAGSPAVQNLTGTGTSDSVPDIAWNQPLYQVITQGGQFPPNGSTEPFTLTNLGAGPTGALTLSLGGKDNGEFIFASPPTCAGVTCTSTGSSYSCTEGLPANGTCTVSIGPQFDNTEAVAYNALLQAQDAATNDQGSPPGIPVATPVVGKGSPTPNPNLVWTGTQSVTPISQTAALPSNPIVNGPAVLAPYTPASFTLTNEGAGPTGTLAIALADPTYFLITASNNTDGHATTCGTSLASGASCTVWVLPNFGTSGNSSTSLIATDTTATDPGSPSTTPVVGRAVCNGSGGSCGGSGGGTGGTGGLQSAAVCASDTLRTCTLDCIVGAPGNEYVLGANPLYFYWTCTSESSVAHCSYVALGGCGAF